MYIGIRMMRRLFVKVTSSKIVLVRTCVHQPSGNSSIKKKETPGTTTEKKTSDQIEEQSETSKEDSVFGFLPGGNFLNEGMHYGRKIASLLEKTRSSKEKGKEQSTDHTSSDFENIKNGINVGFAMIFFLYTCLAMYLRHETPVLSDLFDWKQFMSSFEN